MGTRRGAGEPVRQPHPGSQATEICAGHQPLQDLGSTGDTEQGTECSPAGGYEWPQRLLYWQCWHRKVFSTETYHWWVYLFRAGFCFGVFSFCFVL